MALKIGIVPSQPFHVSLGSDIRVIGIVKSLLKCGLQVYFITPYDPGPIANEQNVTIVNLFGEDFSNQDSFITNTRRLLQERKWARFALLSNLPLKIYLKRLSNALKLALTSLDLDILQGEQELAGYACALVKKSLNIKVAVDLHGVWPEELISRKILTERDFAFRSIRSFENELFKLCDMVITCSPEMKRLLINFYKLNENKVFSMVNGSFTHEFPFQQKTDNNSDVKKVVHAGLLSELENAKLFVDAMPLINKSVPNVEFFLTKKGNLIDEVIRNIETYGLNVHFFYYPDLSDFFRFLSNCDVAVLTSLSTISRVISYPAKLFDYLSVGLPVVANDVGGWSRIIRKTETGLLTKSTPQDLADGVITLLRNSELSDYYHLNGIKAITENYNWDTLGSELVRFYYTQLNVTCGSFFPLS